MITIQPYTLTNISTIFNHLKYKMSKTKFNLLLPKCASLTSYSGCCGSSPRCTPCIHSPSWYEFWRLKVPRCSTGLRCRQWALPKITPPQELVHIQWLVDGQAQRPSFVAILDNAEDIPVMERPVGSPWDLKTAWQSTSPAAPTYFPPSSKMLILRIYFPMKCQHLWGLVTILRTLVSHRECLHLPCLSMLFPLGFLTHHFFWQFLLFFSYLLLLFSILFLQAFISYLCILAALSYSLYSSHQFTSHNSSHHQMNLSNK